jgi:hypothetical protein
MSVQLPVKKKMLFNACEIRDATDAWAPLNGARGMVTDIIKDDQGLFCYKVRFDKQQHTEHLTHAVSVGVVTSPEGLHIVPCGLVFRCASSTPNPGQCLVCAKPSKFKYDDFKDSEAPKLNYCNPACLSDHKQRLKWERDVFGDQAFQSLVSVFEDEGVALTVTTVVFCCSACGKVPTGTEKLRTCGTCRQVRYCDRNCQKLDWSAGHKSKCKELRDS